MQQQGKSLSDRDTHGTVLESVRMLIVEDDPEVGQALEEYFTFHDAQVVRVMDGEKALEMMRTDPPFDIVLLDVSLPKKNGFDVLRESQELGITTPVLMVTARGERENILRGFGLGAEDYVIKPFNADDLMSRIEAILGRVYPNIDEDLESFHVGQIIIDFGREEAYRSGERIPLSELDFALLKTLIINQGRVVTRTRLLRDAWGMDPDSAGFTVSAEVVAQTVDRHVEWIRQQLSFDSEGPGYIETVYGLGYRFKVS